ncbi:MAG: ABC transporter permease [Pseudomonadota bacterium]
MSDVWRRLQASPQGMAGAVILAVVCVVVVLGEHLAPYNPETFHVRDRLAGPGATFWLGSDQFGRDLLSRVLHGARSTVLFGVIATALGTLAGTMIGVLAGYVGGRLDEIIMRVTDGFMSIPHLLLALLIVTVLGASTVNAVLAVAVAFVPGMARVARSATLAVRGLDYVRAAVARGEGAPYIVLREVLPNVAAPVVIEASIRVSFAIMLGATLSFLGLGAQPPSSEWGLMVAEARGYLFNSAWLVVWPGLAIAAVAFGFNLFGDGLRDALNPKVTR